MSVDRIGKNDAMNAFANKIYSSTAAGTIAGGVYAASKKNWIYKGLPSDTFVKNVSTNLREDMSSDELKESAKIRKFLETLVKPETNLEDLKPQILESKELTAAIKKTPDESIGDAFNRVFSQSKEKAKQDLLNLQFKTKSNNKNSKYTAVKLINENFDASQKKLVQSSATSDRTFGMIKSTALKLQAKTVAIGAILTGVAAAALALVVSNVPENKNA